MKITIASVSLALTLASSVQAAGHRREFSSSLHKRQGGGGAYDPAAAAAAMNGPMASASGSAMASDSAYGAMATDAGSMSGSKSGKGSKWGDSAASGMGMGMGMGMSTDAMSAAGAKATGYMGSGMAGGSAMGSNSTMSGAGMQSGSASGAGASGGSVQTQCESVLQMCMANPGKFGIMGGSTGNATASGSAPTPWSSGNSSTASGSMSSGSAGGSANGTTTSSPPGNMTTPGVALVPVGPNNVVVAPAQGVLRYLPFAMTANVGSTVEFTWGAGPHTVTQSSQLAICNKTMAPNAFMPSGMKNKGDTFKVQVKDANPIFIYCSVPNHCAKGMFMIINPPSATSGPNSLGSWMSSQASSNAQLGQMVSQTSNMTKAVNAVDSWGSQFDMSALPDDSFKMMMAMNVLQTRQAMMQSPEVYSAATGKSVAEARSLISNGGSSAANTSSTASSTASSASSSMSAGASPAAQSAIATGGASKVYVGSVSAVLVGVIGMVLMV